MNSKMAGDDKRGKKPTADDVSRKAKEIRDGKGAIRNAATGTFVGLGLLALTEGVMGCGGGSGTQQDAAACNEVKDDAGVVVSCEPAFSCELDTVNNKCVTRQAQSDGPVSSDGQVAQDGGVTDDSGTPDGGPVCTWNYVEAAQVKVTSKVGLGSVTDASGKAVKCGQTSCEGVADKGEALDINGTQYTVASVDETALVATTGTAKIVATAATATTAASCIAFDSGAEQGTCIEALGGSVEYVTPLGWDNTDAAGRTTLTMSVSSTLAPGPMTRQAMLSDGQTKEVTFTTVDLALTVNATLVRGTDGRANVAFTVTNENTSDVTKQPLGLQMDEGVIRQLGPQSGALYVMANSSSDNVNTQCVQTGVKLVVDGAGMTVNDGEVVQINGKPYKVVIQLGVVLDGPDAGTKDSARTYVNFEDGAATKNNDHVIKEGDTKTVNGSIVNVQEVTLVSNYTPQQ